MSKSKNSHNPTWHESPLRRHVYQAWVSDNCTVAIAPDNRERWRWRVGAGDLTTPHGDGVAKEGSSMSRVAAKRAALKAAKQVCPVRRSRRR